MVELTDLYPTICALLASRGLLMFKGLIWALQSMGKARHKRGQVFRNFMVVKPSRPKLSATQNFGTEQGPGSRAQCCSILPKTRMKI